MGRDPANGINYYRLKLIDIDRKIEYSKIVSQFFEKNELKIFPNPAKNIIEIEGIQLDSTLELISETGQNLAGKVTISQNIIDVSQLPKGKYFLSIKGKSLAFLKN
jgi:Secretion system C-terminal sorting domain